jgi:hypothetical protein
MRSTVALLLLVGLLGACGGDDGELTTGAPAADQRYEASTTVLESPEHGPQLCLGGQADSYPPQCGGPDIVGWDWAAVEGAETANGTTWGSFHVVGTYVDGTFTLTEPPGPPEPPDSSDPDFSSPCPEPEGGWAVVDPALATEASLQEAQAYASAQPDHAVLWVDRSIDPLSPEERDQRAAEGIEDELVLVILNVAFTGDLERHEVELRRRWGGALCVSRAEHTAAELRQIQDELADTPGLLGSGSGNVRHRVELTVILDDGTLQAELDDRYGEGVVVVTSALQPVA